MLAAYPTPQSENPPLDLKIPSLSSSGKEPEELPEHREQAGLGETGGSGGRGETQPRPPTSPRQYS